MLLDKNKLINKKNLKYQFKMKEDFHLINLKDLQVLQMQNKKIVHQVQYIRSFFKTKNKHYNLLNTKFKIIKI